jgi:D-inositol-3-phosphate glycosyltransferase
VYLPRVKTLRYNYTMISFIWYSMYPVLSGTGGSENYTVGQVRELNRRGIPAQIVTVGLGRNDGRANFKDVKFLATDLEHVSKLSGYVIFVTHEGAWVRIPTKNKAYVILHIPPEDTIGKDTYIKALNGKGLLVPSEYSRRVWGDYLGRYDLQIVYPFATPEFAQVRRSPTLGKILFAGRLTAGKGIYTLLAALTPFDAIDPVDVVSTGLHTPEGKILSKFLKHHPKINIIPAAHTPEAMAELLAGYEVVVMPSTDSLWHESFGILSVEAQHAGCRVVASRGGGIPETDCGGLILIEPDNPIALREGILEGLLAGKLSANERSKATQHFTLEASVDALLKAIDYSDKFKRVQNKN